MEPREAEATGIIFSGKFCSSQLCLSWSVLIIPLQLGSSRRSLSPIYGTGKRTKKEDENDDDDDNVEIIGKLITSFFNCPLN